MTAITPSVATNLLQTTGRRVLACIGNPVPFSEVPPGIQLDKVKNRAVCIARLERVKGHRHLLAAWRILRDRGHQYQLDLIGEGTLRTELELQTRRDGTQDLIRFHGFRSDIDEFLRDSLFAILVSEVEGQGIVTLEAAAMGRATLLTAVPGSIDLLPPARRLKNSLEFANVEQTADVLEEWFAYPEDVVREGENFFYFLRDSSAPQAIAQAYENVYRGVCLKPFNEMAAHRRKWWGWKRQVLRANLSLNLGSGANVSSTNNLPHEEDALGTNTANGKDRLFKAHRRFGDDVDGELPSLAAPQP